MRNTSTPMASESHPQTLPLLRERVFSCLNVDLILSSPPRSLLVKTLRWILSCKYNSLSDCAGSSRISFANERAA